MNKILIETQNAPQPIGAYTQAIKFKNRVYISGQIPIDPNTMELVSGDTRTHVAQTLKNINAIVEASGGSFSDIVKLNVFLVDLNHFTIVNEVFDEFFVANYPARSLVVVSALPKNAIIEIDATLELDTD
jgi:reactive intermediate/imine deaminase